jgi:hypothetical protein
MLGSAVAHEGDVSVPHEQRRIKLSALHLCEQFLRLARLPLEPLGFPLQTLPVALGINSATRGAHSSPTPELFVEGQFGRPLLSVFARVPVDDRHTAAGSPRELLRVGYLGRHVSPFIYTPV